VLKYFLSTWLFATTGQVIVIIFLLFSAGEIPRLYHYWTLQGLGQILIICLAFWVAKIRLNEERVANEN
jgi:hypothetical protein